ncbi:MAG: GIY-YIG nuclease family protein [Desulfitobacteriaceae bacterium]|nr:GIY-YIG nuclease family protein [Desulfitobacteriaceae bacterium]
MFRVYAIKSRKFARIYIGQTINLEKRLSMHNKGQVKSTQRDRPWVLIAFETFETRAQARWKEFNLKKSRGMRLKWLEKFSTVHALSELEAGGGSAP